MPEQHLSHTIMNLYYENNQKNQLIIKFNDISDYKSVLEEYDFKKLCNNINQITYLLDFFNRYKKDEYIDSFYDSITYEDFLLYEHKILLLSVVEQNIEMGTNMDRPGDKAYTFQLEDGSIKEVSGIATSVMISIQRISEIFSRIFLEKLSGKKIVLNPEATHRSEVIFDEYGRKKRITAAPDFVMVQPMYSKKKIYIEVQQYFREEMKEDDKMLLLKYSKFKDYQALIRQGHQVYHVTKIINPKTWHAIYLIYDINKIFRKYEGKFISEENAETFGGSISKKLTNYKNHKMMLFPNCVEYKDNPKSFEYKIIGA